MIHLDKKSCIVNITNNKAKRKHLSNKKHNKILLILVSLLILLIPNEYNINLRKKKIYCLLFDTHNEHLFKEAGLLTWGMHKYFGYDSFIATYKNDDYENLKLLPGLRIEFIPKICNNFEIDSLIWLTTNAKRIDVLNVIHFLERTKRFIKLFKKLNPSGKAYLKLDDGLKYQNISEDTSYIDFISIEFKEFTSILSKEFYRAIGFVPNLIESFSETSQFKFLNNISNINYICRVDNLIGCISLCIKNNRV